eukprot:4141137-Ditylum_brightwellii.AAC.1
MPKWQNSNHWILLHVPETPSLNDSYKGTFSTTSSNGMDMENIKRKLHAVAADSTKHTKEVATH